MCPGLSALAVPKQMRDACFAHNVQEEIERKARSQRQRRQREVEQVNPLCCTVPELHHRCAAPSLPFAVESVSFPALHCRRV